MVCQCIKYAQTNFVIFITFFCSTTFSEAGTNNTDNNKENQNSIQESSTSESSKSCEQPQTSQKVTRQEDCKRLSHNSKLTVPSIMYF